MRLIFSGALTHNVSCLGVYSLVEERRANGRPVWKHGQADRWLARTRDGDWGVQQEKNLGGSRCCLLLSDPNAMLPHQSSVLWQVREREGDGGGAWKEATGLKCVADPLLPANLVPSETLMHQTWEGKRPHAVDSEGQSSKCQKTLGAEMAMVRHKQLQPDEEKINQVIGHSMRMRDPSDQFSDQDADKENEDQTISCEMCKNSFCEDSEELFTCEDCEKCICEDCHVEDEDGVKRCEACNEEKENRCSKCSAGSACECDGCQAKICFDCMTDTGRLSARDDVGELCPDCADHWMQTGRLPTERERARARARERV